MTIFALSHCSVCILGFGREGKTMLEAMEKVGIVSEIIIADRSEHLDSEAVKQWSSKAHFQLGDDYLKDLDRFDVIIVSPGIRPCPELEAMRDKVTNSTQIFLDTVQEKGATVIGITGSKGKSTTASIIHAILKKSGKDAYLVGNIGIPAIGMIDKAQEDAIFVLEMSSYQLLYVTARIPIAVITSFFPEHLDYHASTTLSAGKTPLENYMDAKKQVVRGQKTEDSVFFDLTSEGAREIASVSSGNQIGYKVSDAPVTIDQTKLLGEHNLHNIAAATSVARHLGISDDVIISAIKTFEGLPHRLQLLGEHHGIRWVDDAISTTPETTIAALDALGDDVFTIILGGQDRGLDFTELAQRICSSSIGCCIFFKEGSGLRIKEAIECHGEAARTMQSFTATSMEQAVSIAKKNTPKGKICLLSTASPSYGIFKDFEEKGEEFRNAILYDATTL